MPLHLFAGLRVRDFQGARPWSQQLPAVYRDPDGNEQCFARAGSELAAEPEAHAR